MKPGSKYGPFKYRPIKDRPKFALPSGARVALWINPNVEFFGLELQHADLAVDGVAVRMG